MSACVKTLWTLFYLWGADWDAWQSRIDEFLDARPPLVRQGQGNAFGQQATPTDICPPLTLPGVTMKVVASQPFPAAQGPQLWNPDTLSSPQMGGCPPPWQPRNGHPGLPHGVIPPQMWNYGPPPPIACNPGMPCMSPPNYQPGSGYPAQLQYVIPPIYVPPGHAPNGTPAS